MESAELGKIEVRGVEYPVTVEARRWQGGKPDASFSTEVGGLKVSADTLSGLYDKLMLETKKQAVKIAVPFMVYRSNSLTGPRMEEGTVTQRNVRSNKFVVRWDDGSVDRDYYNYSGVFRVLTPEEQVEYLNLAHDAKEAEKARRKFAEEHELKLTAAVDAAIEEALKA